MIRLNGNPVAHLLRFWSATVQRRIFAILAELAVVLALHGSAVTVPAADSETASKRAPSATDLEFFEKKIRPILVEKCQQCHGAEKQKGGLRLDTHKSLLKGGDSGQVITPGKPDESLLVEVVQYTGDYKMPPSGKLPPEQIASLTEWVQRGAPWPLETISPDKGSAAKPAPFNLEERRKQWALQPVRRPALPKVPRSDWVKSPIDAFILRRLDEAGLSPAPAADRRALLRRVTFDLIGLPPTREEIDAFLNDRSPEAFARVVDRLLASPHYGEKWARHWLDLVRYAETYGHEFDYEIPHAHEYRDYVIRALNADIAYDQFVLEHIAGDLLDKPRRNSDPKNHFNESIIGTGFWFFGEAKHSPVDLRADQDERIDNQIDVLGKTFLGMTLGCARCHDHKFDAISTKDYYALAGYLQSSRYQVVNIDGPEVRAKPIDELKKAADLRDLIEMKRQLAGRISEPDALSARYLLAAVQVYRESETKPNKNEKVLPGNLKPKVAEVARQKGLTSDELQRWVDCLWAAESDPGSLFAPWLEWARQSRDSKLKFEDFRTTLIKKNHDTQKHLQKLRYKSRTFASVGGKPDFSDWTNTGEAFFNRAGKRTSNSAASSEKLRGTLRSRTFTIEKPWIHYLATGKNSRIRLVVDGLQLIQDPLYGRFQIALGNNSKTEPAWYRQPVEKILGHRAYIELVDDGDGWLDVEEILFSNTAEPPRRPEPDLSLLLEDPKATTELEWAQNCANAIETGRIEMISYSDDRDLLTPLPPSINDESTEEPLNRRLLCWTSRQFQSGWIPGERKDKIFGHLQSQQVKLQKQIAEIDSKIEYRRHALTLGDGSPVDEPVHLRGNYKFPGEVVPRRFLEALGGTKVPASKTGSGRLELAQQIASPENPLTARVMVNRLWKQHFGEGLVRTPDDFGNMGRAPTHPELLDFLASEFVRNGWSLKKLHRQLLLSSTYQMSSRPDDTRAETSDPQNLLLHRMPVRRLEAEAIRDAMLAVSGRLDRTMYGPSVAPHLTPFMEGRGRPANSGPLDGAGRRTIYLAIRRNFLNPFLLAFDTPVPFATMGKRNVTNVPAQALALLNNPFVLQQAEVWAKRTIAAGKDPAARIESMYISAFARSPTKQELADALAFVDERLKSADPQRVWSDLAHVLMNVKEFIFLN